jgi:hypothetical protein
VEEEVIYEDSFGRRLRMEVIQVIERNGEPIYRLIDRQTHAPYRDDGRNVADGQWFEGKELESDDDDT